MNYDIIFWITLSVLAVVVLVLVLKGDEDKCDCDHSEFENGWTEEDDLAIQEAIRDLEEGIKILKENKEAQEINIDINVDNVKKTTKKSVKKVAKKAPKKVNKKK